MRYIFYEIPNNTIVCVTRYKGQLIKAKAKCSPLDTYDIERGKKIAQARVMEKLAKKKHANALKRYIELSSQYDKLYKQLQKAALKAAEYDGDMQYAKYHLENILTED